MITGNDLIEELNVELNVEQLEIHMIVRWRDTTDGKGGHQMPTQATEQRSHGETGIDGMLLERTEGLLTASTGSLTK